ncbi:MAG: hypothetical protein KKC76_05795, partial [Proteobacteria bacterium]|nr:hypothetical protein [Pseudomonadota bacterium]
MAAVKEILAKTEGSSLDLGQTVVFLIKNIFVDNILADCRAPGAGTIVQRDWQAEGGTRLVEKKVRDQPVIMIRQAWIDKGDAVPMVRQCDLAGVS